MATKPSKTNRHSSDRRWSWVIALATTSLVAVAGFALAVHQFILKFLYDQSSYTRTLGGVLFFVLGFAGICLPIVLLRNRRLFLSLRPSLQWLLAGGIPLLHVLVLVVCLETAQRSTTILLPRPFTPTAIVHYRPGGSRIEFRGGWRPDIGPSGSRGADVLPDGSEEFSSHLAISQIRRPFAETETVAIVGRAKREHDDSVISFSKSMPRNRFDSP